MWNYLRRRHELENVWGGPFNGQQVRRQIFYDLLDRLPIAAIVETGTFRGATTALFASTELPVYSAEINARFYGFVKMRFLFDAPCVHLHNEDARVFLERLSADQTVSKKCVFFYLDAHRKGDLPVRDELNIIGRHWENPVVMIDDFQVPRSSYVFGRYGAGQELTLSHIESTMAEQGLCAFFPVVGAEEETGKRRGCVVLCRNVLAEQIGRCIDSLAVHEDLAASVVGPS